MPLLSKIKKRRLLLKIKQNDMYLRAGISRQQYQQIESKGNPRLSTLELIAEGLSCELMLIPKEKKAQVMAVLNDEEQTKKPEVEELIHDPWKDILDKND